MKQTVPRDERLISFDYKDEREREKRTDIIPTWDASRLGAFSELSIFSERFSKPKSQIYLQPVK